ncbi:Colicin V production protein [Oribacterium sp. KHPX15]|uniref:CvpA family protein n=1 Tax=Oribacterium sp. KHPX15 TaxID=1855342 RepID=UPI000899B08B|nr:CvpA family protein [Oribacterium sp. KHPX15]SEA93078.1 Colicin V production protein [Oribacterium sp. KHPX15]
MTVALEVIKNDWVQISVITFMVVMLISGYCKGLVKMSSNLVTLIMSIVITRMAKPHFQEWLKNNEAVRSFVSNKVEFLVTEYIESTVKNSTQIQNESLSDNNIVNAIIKNTLENSDGDISELLGIDKIANIITEKISDFVLSIITFLVLMIVITIIMKLIFYILDKIVALPVLSVINRVSGAILGLIESILYIWIIFIVLSLFPKNEFINDIMEQINRKGTWIYFLKESNLFIKVFELIIMSGLKK